MFVVLSFPTFGEYAYRLSIFITTLLNVVQVAQRHVYPVLCDDV